MKKNTYIDNDVVIGDGSTIHPFVFLKGSTKMGKNVEIKPFTTIENSIIGDNSVIDSSQIEDSIILNNVKIGPMSHIRPNSKIGSNSKIGNFVEIKNSNLDEGVKVAHLTYIGDSDIGKNVNIGCGVVFVNYNGAEKFRSIVEDNAFIGCNVNIISPVTIAKNSYIAAGSTVTINTEENDLLIARQRERIIKNWEFPKKK